MTDIGRISVHADENILVVEDSPTQAEKLRYLLEKNHYGVAVAANGNSALAMIEQEKPALIISDILMPGMDGYELCSRIKSHDNSCDIPVILLTSLSDPQGVIRGLACGADNFITKPYDEGLLLSRIRDMLENRQLELEPSELPGLEISFASQKYLITSGRRQILDLLLSTYEAAIQKNNELIMARDELHMVNEELEKRVVERTEKLAATIENLTVEISERKIAEESVLRLNRLYAVLSETNQAIVRTKDRETLFNEFCRIAVEEGGFKLAWVGLVDEEDGMVKIMAAKGATGYLDDIKITVNEEPEGFGPTGISVREGTYYICNDFLGSPVTRPWHDRGRAYDFRALASIALKQEGRVIGVLSLYADKKDFFDRQQVELLRQMGADVTFALDNIVRETRRQEVERDLREETAERLRAMESLREKEQMLIQQSRQAAMGEMIGNIAHQWRQPLNTLGLMIQQLLLYYDLGEFSREFLEKNVGNSMELIQHMSKTIDDFRNYFRPDREKIDFKVIEAIENSLSLLEGSLQTPQISIELVTKDDPVICGYQNEFSQVLLNILINARDALMEREIDDPRVTITIFSEGRCAVVTVADNAGGIPHEIMGKIFDPYFTTKGPQQGTGVGLFMSKAIIEKNMGGRLAVRNIANGAEFRIEVCSEIQD